MQVEEGFVASEGHRLAYLAVNQHLEPQDDQPPVVFIHGVLASVNFWRACVPPGFREGRAWYSLSLPAHYPSTVPGDFLSQRVDDDWFCRVMSGALEALLGERKAIIVGHSTGGYSALTLAAHNAPNVLGIVSVAGFHSGKWGGVEGALVKMAGMGRWTWPLFRANLEIAKRSRLVRRMFASLLANDDRAYRANPLSQRMLDNIRDDVLAQEVGPLFHLFSGIYALEMLDGFSTITMPCYLFAGTHDPVVPAEQSLALAGCISGAKTVVFNDTGHMPFIEDTQAYCDALNRALADIAEQSSRQ